MNNEIINGDKCYKLAEEIAGDYFQSLQKDYTQGNYVQTLMKDFQSWKQKHIGKVPFSSLLTGKKSEQKPSGYHNYIRYLDFTGKLEPYLVRSISYIFLRDLGKTLNTPDTDKRIQEVVSKLKKQLKESTKKEDQDVLSYAKMYRKAQEDGIEHTVIWLFEKLRDVSAHIPEELDAANAQRKLIKIIAGVLMHEMEEMDDDLSFEERRKRLDAAIRLGYSYGLTYPFIDDLLDSDLLSVEEKERYSNLIRTSLTAGEVPPLQDWTGENADFIHYVHAELREAFNYIKEQQQPEHRKNFFEQAYVFFHSQEVDRNKEMSNPNYTNEELYIPIILKSASSRLIARSVLSVPTDGTFNLRTLQYGIYNQLADDFSDMFHDLENGAVTPYTYYITYHKERPDLINPFQLYWTVIVKIIHDVYQSDVKTMEVILDRAINSLKRFKEKWGTEKYNEVMQLFAIENLELNETIQKMVQKATDVDFFDKLLRDHMITNIENDQKVREDFQDTLKIVRERINEVLPITNEEGQSDIDQQILNAANYSLEGDAKRLRPIMTWFVAVKGYGLKEEETLPLLKSLEYMHTASLIYDDLPAQDNASLRRGRPTIHQVYNTAIAELTGLFLTQVAIEEQTSLKTFDPKSVLELISYSAKMTQEMCKGQAMDLVSAGKPLTLEQLNMMSLYKTSLGFEASLMMPAILVNASDSEKEALKTFAQHAGIAFQIKDDLLDVEGNQQLLGKQVGKDFENNSSTFVSILGIEGAKKEMWEHYCTAMETLNEIPRNISFLKQLLNYIVFRDH